MELVDFYDTFFCLDCPGTPALVDYDRVLGHLESVHGIPIAIGPEDSASIEVQTATHYRGTQSLEVSGVRLVRIWGMRR